jgi:hypothetical protein
LIRRLANLLLTAVDDVVVRDVAIRAASVTSRGRDAWCSPLIAQPQIHAGGKATVPCRVWDDDVISSIAIVDTASAVAFESVRIVVRRR